MSRIIISFVLVFLGFQLFAQYEVNDNCMRAYRAIISLDFDEGRLWLEKEKAENPDNLIPVYYENYIDFLTLLIGEKESDFNNLKPNKRERINELEKGDPSSPYYNYCLANVYLQWAFARVKFGQHVNAFFEIRKAYRLLEENRLNYPEFLPDNTGMGLLHALVGSVPDNYSWVTDIIGMDGSVNEGVRELQQVVDSAINNQEYAHLLPESLFFLTFIQLNLSKEEQEAIEIKQMLDSLPSKNPLIVFAKVSILMKTGHNDEAIEVLTNFRHDRDAYPFHYLKYLLGLAKLSRLDEDADRPLLEFIIYYEGKNYRASACQKVAWHHLIRGDTLGYKEYINKALFYTDGIVEEDKQALMEAESGIIPNAALLKARLLFDGGYHEKALGELQKAERENHFETIAEQTEYYYRKGRVYHEMKEFDQALSSYKTAIEKGKGLNRYFAGNAALKSGNIFELLEDHEQAKKMYNKCLSLNFTEYEKGIKAMAKAGLDRIEE